MKFVLKQSSVLELTIAEDNELHSQMDLRKKEKLKTSFRILGILYLKAWLLRVHAGLAIRHKKSFCFNIYMTMTQFVRVR